MRVKRAGQITPPQVVFYFYFIWCKYNFNKSILETRLSIRVSGSKEKQEEIAPHICIELY
jgi:hypothetical protein